VPHNIVFVPERTNEAQAVPWEPKTLKNVVVNINKYKAKYDFDIAQKFNITNSIRNVEAEKHFKNLAIFEILMICSYEFTKNKTIYSSIWNTQGQQISDLNDVPKDC